MDVNTRTIERGWLVVQYPYIATRIRCHQESYCTSQELKALQVIFLESGLVNREDAVSQGQWVTFRLAACNLWSDTGISTEPQLFTVCLSGWDGGSECIVATFIECINSGGKAGCEAESETLGWDGGS